MDHEERTRQYPISLSKYYEDATSVVSSTHLSPSSSTSSLCEKDTITNNSLARHRCTYGTMSTTNRSLARHGCAYDIIFSTPSVRRCYNIMSTPQPRISPPIILCESATSNVVSFAQESCTIIPHPPSRNGSAYEIFFSNQRCYSTQSNTYSSISTARATVTHLSSKEKYVITNRSLARDGCAYEIFRYSQRSNQFVSKSHFECNGAKERTR